MAGTQAKLERAAASHRRAVALARAAETIAQQPPPRQRAAERATHELAAQLRAAASALVPGWLGVPLDAVPAGAPLGGADRAERVRIGMACPLDDASFPVVVPLGHLAFDADARDTRVAAVLQAVLLRLLANCRAGSLLIRPVDATGGVFEPFGRLRDAGLMAEPVRDRAGLQALLREAEQWRRARDQRRSLVLVVASWPARTEAEELTRFARLAAEPIDRLHLLVGGWPPPHTGDAPTGPLPQATQVALRDPYALVGHPPGESFAAAVPPDEAPSPGLNAPVYLDPPPPAELITQVCQALAGRVTDPARPRLGDLLPSGPLRHDDGAAGLAVVVGRGNADALVTLRLADATPHWLIAGRQGSGKTALLLTILYGLCSRYGPDQLATDVLDLGGGFADLMAQPGDPSRLPLARPVGIAPDRPAAVAVLRDLAGRLAAAPAGPVRRVCLLDGVDTLIADGDPLGQEATALLEQLTRHGGAHGIHLVLAGRTPPPASIAAGCRVRIALPGGSAALDPANQAAVALPLGTAIVNTASGLGGPIGATRAHEQLVRFPDPYADRAALAGLPHRLWRAEAATRGDAQ